MSQKGGKHNEGDIEIQLSRTSSMPGGYELYGLIDKYLQEKATAEDAAIVDAWYASFEDAPGIKDVVTDAELIATKQRIRDKLNDLFCMKKHPSEKS